LKKMLKAKNEQIKELKERLYKINELNNIKEEVVNEKVEQGKIKAEITNNNINDNSKEGQDKKEINEKLENKNDVKEDNINNKKNYENQGETTEKELGEINVGNNEKKDKNLNNKDNNSNDFITPFGSTPTGNQDIHIDISLENENRGQENNNNTEDNTKNLMNIKNNYLTSKIPVQSRNVEQSNIIQNRNQNGNQNNVKNNNTNNNNLNNNIFKTETSTTKSKYQNNSKNNQNESINKTIDKKAAKEKYKKELDKLRKDIPDLLQYSDDDLLEALSKNNGDINKLEEYLFNYLIEYQKKRKWYNQKESSYSIIIVKLIHFKYYII